MIFVHEPLKYTIYIFFFSRNTKQWLLQPVPAAPHLPTGESAGDAACQRPRLTPLEPLRLSRGPLGHLGPQLAGLAAHRPRTQRRHVQQRPDGGRQVYSGRPRGHADNTGAQVRPGDGQFGLLRHVLRGIGGVQGGDRSAGCRAIGVSDFVEVSWKQFFCGF